MKNIILSAFADEYDADFETQLKGLNKFDIKYIEIRFVNGKNISTLDDDEIAQVKTLLDKYQIKVNAIGSPLGKIRLDQDTEEHLRLTERVCRIANMLDCKYIRMFSFYAPKGEDIVCYRSKVLDLLGKMADIALERGVVLCHENEANIFGESPKACLDVLQSLNGKLKAVFDMGNFALGGYDALEAYALLKNHIQYFHIKDGFKDGRIVPPGKGEAEIAKILADYTEKCDNPVFITLEPHLQTFDGLNALTDNKLEHEYVYETQMAAFEDAVNKIKEIIR